MVWNGLLTGKHGYRAKHTTPLQAEEEEESRNNPDTTTLPRRTDSTTLIWPPFPSTTSAATRGRCGRLRFYCDGGLGLGASAEEHEAQLWIAGSCRVWIKPGSAV